MVLVQGSGFRVQGLGFRVDCLGLWVLDFKFGFLVLSLGLKG